MNKPYVVEVFGFTQFNVAAADSSSNRLVYWPGGHGRLVVAGLVLTGTARIDDLGIQISGYPLTNAGTLVPGVNSYNIDGVYEFNVPAGLINLQLFIPTGDSLSVTGVYLISC